MDIYEAIQVVQTRSIRDQQDALDVLNVIPLEVRQQLVCAIYLGRDHIHCDEIRSDAELSCHYISHIPTKDYARILDEKSDSLDVYLGKILECAEKSGFDLRQL